MLKRPKGSLPRLLKPRSAGSTQIWKLELSYVHKAWPQKPATHENNNRILPICLVKGQRNATYPDKWSGRLPSANRSPWGKWKHFCQTIHFLLILLQIVVNLTGHCSMSRSSFPFIRSSEGFGMRICVCVCVKISGLKQHKFTTLQFWESEIWNGFQRAKLMILKELCAWSFLFWHALRSILKACSSREDPSLGFFAIQTVWIWVPKLGEGILGYKCSRDFNPLVTLPWAKNKTNIFFQGVPFLVHHISSLGECWGFCGHHLVWPCPSDSALSANALKLNTGLSDCEIILSSV